ncbi:phosphoribosylglycinamide formyltransferase [Phycicoccus sp. Root101]|uniref:phosphoribosylglycinamide formyltransferase n=1 Tax=Phycicoccus sp. Root101 TaxID=1736421 RepID=UPI000703C107|nr:phosphoribosylglycinamide formyltransferase [Phycicoccus sp. Root101]KQU69592.1 phosphoribosylglycinamide formyltransferase [Phycicoccus sp. Root101]
MTADGTTQPTGIVVLISGSGTNLQALIDATADPAYGVRILAVGADRAGISGLHKAAAAGIPTFVVRVEDHDDRADWDAALAERIADHEPAFVVSAGFMKILGPRVLGDHVVLNTHPALLPAFPGAHAVRDALAAGATVTGCTVHVVDAGVDTGPVIAQSTVEVQPGDTEDTLHERIKAVEHLLLVNIVGRAAREGITVTDGKVSIP